MSASPQTDDLSRVIGLLDQARVILQLDNDASDELGVPLSAEEVGMVPHLAHLPPPWMGRAPDAELEFSACCDSGLVMDGCDYIYGHNDPHFPGDRETPDEPGGFVVDYVTVSFN